MRLVEVCCSCENFSGRTVYVGSPQNKLQLPGFIVLKNHVSQRKGLSHICVVFFFKQHWSSVAQRQYKIYKALTLQSG